MKTEVHKIELMVTDFDRLGAREVVATLEHTKYPNYCIGPRVVSIDTIEVDWSDEHPLNQLDHRWIDAYYELFGDNE